MLGKHLSSLTVVSILASAVMIMLAGFATFRNVQGQGNLTQGNATGGGNVTLTPEQKAAICNPNNPLSKLNPVNTTESKICGIPKTWNPSNTTTATTETGTETETPSEVPPDTSIAPEAAPSSQ